MLVSGRAKGGLARAASLSAEARREIAKRGAAARWRDHTTVDRPRSASSSDVKPRIAELRSLKTSLEWSNTEIARRTGVTVNTVTGWFKVGPPGPALAYLRLMAKVREVGR